MAVIINSTGDNTFSLNNTTYAKIFQPLKLGLENIAIYNKYDTKQQILGSTRYDEVSLNGQTYNNQDELLTALVNSITNPDLPAIIDDVLSQLEGLQSGFQGAIDSTDTLPSDGYYLASANGTYSNAGGIVVNLNNGIHYITKQNGSFDLVVVPISIQTTDNIIKDSTRLIESGGLYKFKKDFDLLNKVGKNLFDKEFIIDGKGLSNDGTFFSNATRNVTERIIVSANTTYACTDVRKVSFYDFLGVHLEHFSPASVITSPANSVYAVLSVDDSNLDSAQFEVGSGTTTYEPYKRELKANTVNAESLNDLSVNTEAINKDAVQPWQFKDVGFLNMHDGTLISGTSINLNDGVTLLTNASLDCTYFIPCQPLTEYSAGEMSRVLFYDENRNWLSVGQNLTFTTPSNCHWLRFNLSAAVSYRFQLNEGSVATTPFPQPYKFFFKNQFINQTKQDLTEITKRKYNLVDAYYHWLDGQKFPVAILGDSTTNGNDTTDHTYRPAEPEYYDDFLTSPNSYCSVLQNLLREETGNDILRIYNAGFSGRNSGWALTNIETIFGGDYSDVKMVGISHGINDRTNDYKFMSELFYDRIEGIIKWCLDNDIQPFLMTSQPVIQPFNSVAVGKDSEHVVTVSNRIKKELADKWGLELVDVHDMSTNLMSNSLIPLKNQIFGLGENIIHFGDAGHKFTAELLFSHFCPRVIWSEGGEILDFSTQGIKSTVSYLDVSLLDTFDNGFKIKANYIKDNSDDELLQDFLVFNTSKKQYNLNAFGTGNLEDAYVKVNGVDNTMTSLNTSMGVLDIGLHKLQVWSGLTDKVKWLGLKLTD